MACNCNKSNPEDLPGVPTPTPQFDLMKWLPLIILLIALGWFFFLKSKGPH